VNGESKTPVPLLSVCLITYNHVGYIQQAIDSVLAQKTNFDFELIIADDCSTDGTREILIDYAKINPSRVRLILQQRNVGPEQNWIDLISAPRAKYLAYLEGDDFWTDPLKLQRQIDFLELNPDFVLCYHAFEIKYEGGSQVRRDRSELSRKLSVISFEDILNFSYPKSLTVVFVREILDELDFKNLVRGCPVGDVPLWYVLLLKGKGFFIDKVMGCYRRSPSGVTNSLNGTQSLTIAKIKIIERIIQNDLYHDNSLLREYLAKHYFSIFSHTGKFVYCWLSTKNVFLSKYFFVKVPLRNRVTLGRLMVGLMKQFVTPKI